MTEPGRMPTLKEMEQAFAENDYETIQRFNDYEDDEDDDELMPMTAEQWGTLEECIGKSTVDQLKGLITALRMMPDKAAALELGPGATWHTVMAELQRVPGASEADAAILETLSEAVEFAVANGALIGDESPLA